MRAALERFFQSHATQQGVVLPAAFWWCKRGPEAAAIAAPGSVATPPVALKILSSLVSRRDRRRAPMSSFLLWQGAARGRFLPKGAYCENGSSDLNQAERLRLPSITCCKAVMPMR